MSLFSKDQELVCPGCGNKVQSTDRFCKYCGRTLVQAATAPQPSSSQKTKQCTGCGREIPEGLKFCPYCGKPTQVTAPVEAAPSIQPAPIQVQSVPAPQPAVPASPPLANPKKPMPKCVSCGREIPGRAQVLPLLCPTKSLCAIRPGSDATTDTRTSSRARTSGPGSPISDPGPFRNGEVQVLWPGYPFRSEVLPLLWQTVRWRTTRSAARPDSPANARSGPRAGTGRSRTRSGPGPRTSHSGTGNDPYAANSTRTYS